MNGANVLSIIKLKLYEKMNVCSRVGALFDMLETLPPKCQGRSQLPFDVTAVGDSSTIGRLTR